MPVQSVPLPAESKLPSMLRRIDFMDAHQVAAHDPEISAFQAYVAVFADEPRWMRGLMELRGKIATRFGLMHDFDKGKPLTPASSLAEFSTPGVRAGGFTVQSVLANEFIVGDNDRHLDFRISVLRHQQNGKTFITVATAVEIHNFLGRVYMFVVKPFHRFIAPFMLRRAFRQGKI